MDEIHIDFNQLSVKQLEEIYHLVNNALQNKYRETRQKSAEKAGFTKNIADEETPMIQFPKNL